MSVTHTHFVSVMHFYEKVCNRHTLTQSSETWMLLCKISAYKLTVFISWVCTLAVMCKVCWGGGGVTLDLHHSSHTSESLDFINTT